jgi:hypothetical protein
VAQPFAASQLRRQFTDSILHRIFPVQIGLHRILFFMCGYRIPTVNRVRNSGRLPGSPGGGTRTKNDRRQAFAALALSLNEFNTRQEKPRLKGFRRPGITPKTSDKPSASLLNSGCARWRIRLAIASRRFKIASILLVLQIYFLRLNRFQRRFFKCNLRQ